MKEYIYFVFTKTVKNKKYSNGKNHPYRVNKKKKSMEKNIMILIL